MRLSNIRVGGPDFIRQLTKSLLKRDFNLKLELPDDKLCPPVSLAGAMMVLEKDCSSIQVPVR